MSDNELLIQKNRELHERRTKEAKPAVHSGVAAEVELNLKNMNVISNAEADKIAAATTFKVDVERLLDLANIPIRHRRREVVMGDKFAAWAEKFDILAGKMGTGTLAALVGTYGNGKTQLAVQLIKLNASRGVRSLFSTAEDFFTEIKSTFRQGTSHTERDVVNRYRKPQLVVLDEIGANTAKEWEMRPLFQLLNHRYNDQKDTVLISNCKADELFEILGMKIKSRMSESGAIFDCKWGTFR